MEDFIFAPLVILFGLMVHARLLRSHSNVEQRLLWFGFAAHVAGGFAVLAIYTFYYGYGDMFSYHDWGIVLADYVRSDVGRGLSELVNLFFQRQNYFPFAIESAGSSTGSTMAISAVLHLALGDSMLAASLL